MVRVSVEAGETEEELEFSGSTVEDLLRATDRLPHSHIVIMNGRPVPITDRLNDGDEVKIVKVASGG